MALSRYSFSKKIKRRKAFSSADTFKIYQAVESGQLSTNVILLEEGQRLDHIAGINYNDSSLWWVIAAASGIGWSLQVPPGTVIRIPLNITEVYRLLI